MANLFIDAIWRGDRAKQGINETKSALDGLKGAATALGVAFSALAVGNWFKKQLADVEAENVIMTRLAVTLKNVGAEGAAIGKLSDYFNKLQQSTEFADDEIAAAFNRMVLGTNDAAGSLRNLQTAMDLSAATGQSLAEAAQTITMAMEGQVRGIGALLPHLKRYLEELEGVEDPAKRTALAMAAINREVAGAEAAKMTNATGQWKEFTNQLKEFFQTIENKLHILQTFTGLLMTANEIMSGGMGVFNAAGLVEVIGRAQARIAVGPPAPPFVNFGAPFPQTLEEAGWNPAKPPGVGQFQPDARGFAPGPRRNFGGFGSSGLMTVDYNEALASIKKANEAWEKSNAEMAAKGKEAFRAMQSQLADVFVGAFESIKGGWQSLMQFMLETFERIIVRRLAEYFAGKLLTALGVPGGGGGGGGGSIIDYIPGMGGPANASYQRQGAMSANLARRQARW